MLLGMCDGQTKRNGIQSTRGGYRKTLDNEKPDSNIIDEMPSYCEHDTLKGLDNEISFNGLLSTSNKLTSPGNCS